VEIPLYNRAVFERVSGSQKAGAYVLQKLQNHSGSAGRPPPSPGTSEDFALAVFKHASEFKVEFGVVKAKRLVTQRLPHNQNSPALFCESSSREERSQLSGRD
jgi:hypothetical protein